MQVTTNDPLYIGILHHQRFKVRAALKQAKTRYTVHHYPGTNHGFHNDTTPRYDEAAAKLAWERTIAFFNETLLTK